MYVYSHFITLFAIHDESISSDVAHFILLLFKIHMNSTQWTTLTGFAKYLGREGKAIVDETEKGWFITYIDRDPATIAKQAARSQQEAAEMDEEARENRRIEQQLAAMKANTGDGADNEDEMTEEELNLAHSLIRSGEEPLKLNMNLSMKPSSSSSSGKRGTSHFNGSIFGKDKSITNENTHDISDEGNQMNRMKYSAGLSASLMKKDVDLSGKKRQADGDVHTEESSTAEVQDTKCEDLPPSKKTAIEDLEDEPKDAAATVVPLVQNSFLSNLKAASGGKGSLKLASNQLNPNIIPVGDRSAAQKKPVSAIEAFMKEDEQRKKLELQKIDKESRKDYWLHEGIVVKLMNKKLLDGQLYKQKAVVQKVEDKYVGELVLIDKQTGGLGRTRLKMDQDELETTIPRINCPLLIVNGRNRGEKGILLRINEADYNVDLKLDSSGLEMKGIAYEDICKIFQN